MRRVGIGDYLELHAECNMDLEKEMVVNIKHTGSSTGNCQSLKGTNAPILVSKCFPDFKRKLL